MANPPASPMPRPGGSHGQPLPSGVARQNALLVKVAFGLLLLFSLGLNLVLLLGDNEGGDLSDPEGARPPWVMALAQCKHRLSTCEQRQGAEALFDMEALLLQRTAETPASESATDAGTPTAGQSPAEEALPIVEKEVTRELQASVLCDVARTKLFANWRRNRGPIVMSLRKSLSDPVKLDRDMERQVNDTAKHFGWNSVQRQRFADQYAPLRKQTMDILRQEFASKPNAIDYRGVLSTVRRMFQDEDRLIEKLSGSQQRDLYRFYKLEERTVVLAIAAALGDLPPEEALTW